MLILPIDLSKCIKIKKNFMKDVKKIYFLHKKFLKYFNFLINKILIFS
nr:MAG TPA: hypothetical protein [Caudoviricetes sp.]